MSDTRTTRRRTPAHAGRGDGEGLGQVVNPTYPTWYVTAWHNPKLPPG